MGLGSVIATFVMCILFDIILPTGDVLSDLDLMRLTLTFNLGSSIELEGCKSCYYKTEKEVYHPKKNSNDNECKTCLYDPYINCGSYIPILKKVRELEDERHSCLTNESFRRTNQQEFRIGECDEKNDYCCVTQAKETKRENLIQKLDPKKVFSPCYSLTKEFDLCIVLGKESVLYCGRLLQDSKYEELYKSRLIHATHPRHSSTNEKVFFYPYSLINQTVVMQEENHPITDPDVKCGLLLYRHNNEENNYQQPRTLKYVHYYNEDVCHIHLKSLHFSTSITGLKE